MEQYQTLIQTIALTAGASWASGINLYAVLLILGLGGASGGIGLPDDLQVLQNPLVIGAAGFMYCVEFFADKIPGVDSGWDALHTFVRIPAGALLAAGAVGDVTPALTMAAAIVGGGLAATSHATKAGSRLLINTSPEPFTNWGASLLEDVIVIAGLWTALQHPTLFLMLLVLFLLFAAWLLPKIGYLLARIYQTLRRWLTGAVGSVPPRVDEPMVESEFRLVSEPPSSTDADALSQLERLQGLRERGALSDEEFELQKRRLLGF